MGRPFQSPTAPEEESCGEYLLEGRLGRGPYALVYRAVRRSSGEVVALKLYECLWQDLSPIRRRVEKEARNWPDAPSLQLAGFRGAGESKGRLFVASELAPGRSLREFVWDFPLSPSAAAGYIRAAARLLSEWHRRGWLHLNLKPGNILVDEEGRIILTDPARLHPVFRSGRPSGRAPWAAPEQKGDNGGRIGQRTDIYGLGATLYFLLTGARPPSSAGEEEPGGGQAPNPRDLAPHAPPALEAICLKCLERNPARRYGSMLELEEDLARFLRGEPSLARPPGAGRRLWSWARRRPGLAGAWGSIALAAAGALVAGGLYVQSLRSRIWDSLARQARAERALGRRGESLELIRRAAAIARSPSLQRDAVESLLLPEVRLESRVRTGEAAAVLWGPKGRLAAVAGRRIESADALGPGAVWAFDAASGTRLGRIDWDADGGLPAFHPTEPWLAVPQPDGALALWVPGGETPPRRIHPGGSALFSPRGTRLAAVGKEIVVYDTAAWKEVARRQGGAPICWAGEETLILRDGNALILWNPGANSERRLAPPGETPLATAPDGTISLWAADLGEAAGPDGARAARLRSLPDGALLGALQGARLPYLPYPARFSKRGDRLALPDPTDNTILRFFRVPGGAAAGSLKIPGLVFDVIQRGRFHPAGDRSGGYRWQAAREADRISPFRPITSPLARNGRALAASVFTSRPAVEIWDVDEGELIARLNDVTLPSWNRQGTRLACRAAGDSRGPGDEILFWRVRLPSPTLNIGAAIPRLLFGARSETLAADGDLLSLRTEAGEPRLELRSRFRNGHPIAPSARGGFWTVGERVDKGRPLLVLRREPGGKEATLVPRRGAHWAVAIHPTELYALFAFSSPADAKPAWTNNYELWDLGRKAVAARWPQAAPGRAEGRLAYSPDGRWIASSCFASGGVELLRAADGSRLRLLKFPPRREAAKPNAPKSPEDSPAPAEAIDFQFSPDGLLLLAAADDGTTCVWGVNSGRLLWAKTFAKEPPDALAVSPAESLAALAGPGDLIRLIYLRSGETAAQWRAGRMRIAALAFDSSGRYLAAAGDRGRVRLWDVGRLRRELARFGLAW